MDLVGQPSIQKIGSRNADDLIFYGISKDSCQILFSEVVSFLSVPSVKPVARKSCAHPALQNTTTIRRAYIPYLDCVTSDLQSEVRGLYIERD